MANYKHKYETVKTWRPRKRPRGSQDDQFQQYVAAWMRDMALWGKTVSKDIRRLERRLKALGGDPGDPPPPPPKLGK